MQTPIETIELRATSRDLMEIKDAYSLYDTQQAIRWLFNQQYPTKELLLEQGFTTDPCPINTETVVITVKARTK